MGSIIIDDQEYEYKLLFIDGSDSYPEAYRFVTADQTIVATPRGIVRASGTPSEFRSFVIDTGFVERRIWSCPVSESDILTAHFDLSFRPHTAEEKEQLFRAGQMAGQNKPETGTSREGDDLPATARYKIERRGYPAVSVPIGAQPHDTHERCSHDEWIQNDYDWLEDFETITLAMDGDKAGRQAAALLIPRLGRERVAVVEYPPGCKDANECILKGHGVDWSMEHAHDLDPEELKKPSTFREVVWERFYPVDGVEPGDELPWATTADPGAKPLPFKFREEEVTVWQGYNGHGKTIALSTPDWVRRPMRRSRCIVGASSARSLPPERAPGLHAHKGK